MMLEVRCNLCGSDNCAVIYKTGNDAPAAVITSYKITEHKTDMPVRIVKCRKCGLIYVNPQPEESDITAVYTDMLDECYIGEEMGRRISSRSILKDLKRLSKNGRLLDVGCAAGFLLDEARKEGWEVCGVELSRWAADYARKTLGIKDVFYGKLGSAGFADNYFDAAVIKDTIEHLTNPKGTLIEIRRILKPNGILCVNTPDIGSLISRILKARWWGVKQLHLYYFDRKRLSELLKNTGYVPVRFKSHARAFTLNYWINKFKEYSEPLHNILNLLIRNDRIRNKVLRINMGDQIEVYARKARTLKYLEELEKPLNTVKNEKAKVVVVLPAYNAANTLKRTVDDIPRKFVDEIILVDDASSDGTVKIAREIGITTFVHKANKGYGANQKTCYEKALAGGADIVVMVHPDYQYDPRVIPQLIEPIKEGRADAVFGSRMMKGGALEGGMPMWKHDANILLTALENVVFGTFLTEYHSGFRAYSARLLRTVKFQLNSDNFMFDTEIIAQILIHRFKIEEIPIRTRYFDEASTIKFLPCVIYGFGILKTLFKYAIHAHTFIKFKRFQ